MTTERNEREYRLAMLVLQLGNDLYRSNPELKDLVDEIVDEEMERVAEEAGFPYVKRVDR